MQKRFKYIAAAVALVVAGGLFGFRISLATEGATKPPQPAGAVRRAYWRALGIKTAKIQLKTVDAITMKPVPGAGCVIGETADRIETDAKGVGPVIDAPIFRNPRLEQMMAELHGQLTVMCYKKGYRDSVYLGVRMHEGIVTQPEIWMNPIGPGDRRIEPTLYQTPVHRTWLIQLTDKYRLYDQGEGRESPALTRPNAPIAAQNAIGGGLQTPLRPGVPIETRVPERQAPQYKYPAQTTQPGQTGTQPAPQAQPVPQSQTQVPQATPRP